MRNKLPLFSLILMLLSSCPQPAAAQGRSGAKPQRPPAAQAASRLASLEQAALAELKETKTPGAQVAVVSGDRVVFAKGFGVADIETGTHVTTGTLFRIASTTKIFTSATVLSLVEDGKLKLDAPAGDFTRALDPRIARLTISQLLSHTSGMADTDRDYGLHDDSALGDAARSLNAASLFDEPNRIFSYSNVGFDLLGYAIEQASGKPYAETVRERVLVPVGMTRSVFRPVVAMTYPFSQGHAEDEASGKLQVVRPFPDNAAQLPSGYLFSNVVELARFAIAFMNDGRIEGKQVLAPAIIRAMSTPHAEMPVATKEREHWQYGYGMVMRDHRGVRLFEHGGDMTGFSCLFQMVPAKRFAVVILTNKSDAQLNKTAEKALELFLPLSAEEPTHFKSLTLTTEEMARVSGRYVNSEQLQAELFTQGGKLMLKLKSDDEEETAPVIKIAERTYVALPKDGQQIAFLLIAGADGRIEYLHINVRALKKIQ